MTSVRSFYFDPKARGVEVFLGPTEARLMELAWQLGELTVKKALFHYPVKPKPAYTTAMTILGRLAQKGLLKKHRKGKLYSYTPAVARDKFIKERLNTIDNCLKKNFRKVR